MSETPNPDSRDEPILAELGDEEALPAASDADEELSNDFVLADIEPDEDELIEAELLVGDELSPVDEAVEVPADEVAYQRCEAAEPRDSPELLPTGILDSVLGSALLTALLTAFLTAFWTALLTALRRKRSPDSRPLRFSIRWTPRSRRSN